MSKETAEYAPLYLRGIAHFNAREFFEAHEAWEDLWRAYRGELRLFYKGLIQAAVALHHFGNGNLRGARKVYLSSRGYLSEYLPGRCGLDLVKFLGELDSCFAEVAASQDGCPKIDIDPERIPEIELCPPAVLPAVGEERWPRR